jgi:hypothetical protein
MEKIIMFACPVCDYRVTDACFNYALYHDYPCPRCDMATLQNFEMKLMKPPLDFFLDDDTE